MDSTVGRQVALDLSVHQQQVRVAHTALPPVGLQLTETARPLLVTFRDGQKQSEIIAAEGETPREVFTTALRRELGITAETAGLEFCALWPGCR